MRRDGPPNGLWPPPCWAMVGLEVPAPDGRERGKENRGYPCSATKVASDSLAVVDGLAAFGVRCGDNSRCNESDHRQGGPEGPGGQAKRNQSSSCVRRVQCIVWFSWCVSVTCFEINLLDRPRFSGCSPRKFDPDTPPIPNHTWRLATGDLSHIV